MSNIPEDPSDLVERLQKELGEIDCDLESGALVLVEPSDGDLRVAADLAKEGRFSRLSGEVVDDLLSDDDTIEAPLRQRLTVTVDGVLSEFRLRGGALEPLLTQRRRDMGLDFMHLAESVGAKLAESVRPDADRLARVEAGRLRFDEVGEGDAAADIVAAWIESVDLEFELAVAALEQSLPELAEAAFGGGDVSRKTNAQAFVKSVADRLGVEYPLSKP